MKDVSAADTRGLTSGYRSPYLWVGLILVLLQCQLSRTLSMIDPPWLEPPQDRAERWNSELFQVAVFGQLPMAIDWLWIKVLQDQSLEHVRPGLHPQMYYDMDLATDLDPAYFEVYMAGAHLLAIVRDDGIGARNITLKAEEYRTKILPSTSEYFRATHWRGSWAVPLTLAYIYLFELHDLPSAALYYRSAAREPGAPVYLRHLVERLDKPGGEYEVGIRLLGFMNDSNKDPRVGKELRQKRDWLIIGQFLFYLNLDFERFQAAQRPRKGAPDWNRRLSEFLAARHQGVTDPWGGKLNVDATGRIGTTTPHQRVFGMN